MLCIALLTNRSKLTTASRGFSATTWLLWLLLWHGWPWAYGWADWVGLQS